MAAYEGWTSRLEAIGPVAHIIDLWHAYRTSILLTVFGVLFLIWIYMLLTQEREYSVAFRKIYEEPTSAPVDPLTEKPRAPVPAPAPAPAVKESPPSGPRRIKGEVRKPDSKSLVAEPQEKRPIQPLLFFSSLTGSTERLTKGLVEKLDAPARKQGAEDEPPVLPCRILDLADIDYDEYFLSPPKDSDAPVDYLYLLLVPSYNIDTINDTFLEHLKETHNDFRIDTAPLSGLLGYAVFGIGDREGWPTEDEGYCFQAKELDKWMAKLTSRKRAFPLGMADPKRDLTERLVEWTEGIRDVLSTLASTGSLGEGVPGSGDAVESDDEYASDDDGEVLFEEETKEPKKLSKSSSNLEDVEDLGRIMKSSGQDESTGKAPVAIDFTTYGKATKKATQTQTVKEMVPKSSPTYASLTKQGYSIVGSHSGVKIFGTTWRWVVDPPELIFDGVKAGHYKKIKMMRGVPGVRSERFAEAMRVRHCALSLVGEPIFYPHINEFLAMLHAERISSFLVCNAQHPDQLAALKAVTQLYVSIDASNKESLRKIDRPLHRDFWERFQRCLDILREKRFKQRTVFRLTLVKGFNVDDEVEGYADLVERGLPCFVEIKGVTYCGTSSSAGAGLSMANVPFYAEVTDFVTALDRKLKERGLDYGIAAEHAHSCCVLLASGRFRVDGKWHTRIDYQKFFELLEARGADGDWTPEEYMGEATPEWATWGNGGFDPPGRAC
ncbi:Wyosine base formation [Apiospora phragmitis]|uniref:Wyosine base formation n=1 Tax=Apiospora phragmitis TaxID=2905665 RepID=A0ABR1T7K3_9PEZI